LRHASIGALPHPGQLPPGYRPAFPGASSRRRRSACRWSSGPRVGRLSVRSEPSSGLEPLRRRWRVWASGEAVNEGSEIEAKHGLATRPSWKTIGTGLIEAAGKTQSPVMAALGGQHAYGCRLGNDRSPRHSRHWHRRREIVFTARSRQLIEVPQEHLGVFTLI
jgi:hypothetical protein